jgi:phage/plasmid-like protein (TIGR03299 family)
MFTSKHESVENYHAIYREDNNDVVGVVNKKNLKLVQNSDMFNSFETLIGKDLDVETAAALGSGNRVFGCFKVHENYKVVDDDVNHYLVVLNDHLKADGKVMVINTPIRVVCSNTLSQALTNNNLKCRITCSTDELMSATISKHIMEMVSKSKEALDETAQSLLKRKVSKERMEKILDELFPFIKADEDSNHARANERVMAVRENFLTNCMNADNLANYRGTSYQVFNALTDFTQHYYKNVDKGLDLESRINIIPGIGASNATNPTFKVTQFLAFEKKLVA